MLFELFITNYLQIQLLSKDISPHCNSGYENSKLTNQMDVDCYVSGLKCNVQKILRI